MTFKVESASYESALWQGQLHISFSIQHTIHLLKCIVLKVCLLVHQLYTLWNKRDRFYLCPPLWHLQSAVRQQEVVL